MLIESTRPTVSVVIPTFNRPGYLRTAISSVIDQTFKDIEVLVQDNASVEDPTPIVAALGDSRVRLFRNSANIGQTANIIAGCLRATGKYIAVLGDDDLWQPNFLATLVPPLENDPEIVVSFCAHDWMDLDGRPDDAHTKLTDRRHRDRLREGVYGPFVWIALVHRSICFISAAVFRREAIDWKSLPRDLYYCSDVYINYLAARTGKRCYYHPAKLARLRFLESSVSTEATASVAAIEITSRESFLCWDTFLRDGAVSAGRRYFEMRRADNALRIVLCGLHLRGWRAGLQEFRKFLKNGSIRPRPLLYHLIYGRYQLRPVVDKLLSRPKSPLRQRFRLDQHIAE
jgi:glycosyltransferase involved in cell wall biosynthesis